MRTGYYYLAIAAWASLIVLIWLLILDIVPFGSIQFWSLIFFAVLSLVCSAGARGDVVKERAMREKELE